MRNLLFQYPETVQNISSSFEEFGQIVGQSGMELLTMLSFVQVKRLSIILLRSNIYK